MPASEPEATITPSEVHLPVLPTGREEALRRQMLEQTPPLSSASPAAAAADRSGMAAHAPGAVGPAGTTGESGTDTVAAGSVPPAAAPDADRAFRKKLLEGKVIAAIQQIYDPEIPVNIYELGLIYKVDVRDDNSVRVDMTLTAPACPVAGTLPGQVEAKIEEIPEVTRANVELVWDPPWSKDRMSEAALLELGLL
jgi:FeS assembly SUF system protein